VVLEDWIDHLCLGECMSDPVPGAATGKTTAWLQLDPGKLLEKAKKPVARHDKLLGPWVRSLAIAASGVSAHGVLVGRDGVLDISPMPQNEAQETLRLLLSIWREGMNAALPLPPKTALAWLTQKDAASQYDGGYMISGEVDEPCLARMFPDFEALSADGRFDALAQQVYAPLLLWASAHVRARFHSNEPALEVVAV
jgi:exodeoxyribonuclease V gamma subunit